MVRELLAGRTTTWQQLGQRGGTVRLLAAVGTEGSAAQRLPDDAGVVAAVASDRAALGLVPAHAVTPDVRVLRVGGRDPLRDPTSYPMRTPGPPPPPVATVTVVGDVMLGRRVGDAMARQADFAAPLRRMAPRLRAADLTIANLESTLSRDGSPTQGTDSFAADPRIRAGLQLAGIDVVSLANNHVGDWGRRALVKTVRRVRAMGISPVGAGADLARASRPVVVTAAGVRVGVLATDSIGESPAAGPARPGTNRLNMPPRTGPLDRAALGRIVRDVRALRAQVDLVVVVPHWGTQYTHRAEPSQRRVGRALVRAGADLVVGGHPHWVQGVQVVQVGQRRGLVVHSLGNFVFDMDFMQRTQEGVVLEAVVWGGEVKAVDFVPYVIGPDFAPRVVRGARATTVLAPFRATSDPPYDRG